MTFRYKTIDRQEQTSSESVLDPMKGNIWSYCRQEKHHKKQWLGRESQKIFSKNPLKAGKYLFQQKTFIFLSIVKSKLNHHKSDCVNDDKYNIPLGSLQGLNRKPFTRISFLVKSLDFNDFLREQSTMRLLQKLILSHISV